MICEKVVKLVRIVKGDKRFAILRRAHRGSDFRWRDYHCLLAKHADALMKLRPFSGVGVHQQIMDQRGIVVAPELV